MDKIKNLHIYAKNIGKKLKLQFCSICLTVALVIGGCSFNNNSNNSDDIDDSNMIKTESSVDLPSNSDIVMDEVSTKIVGSSIKLSSNDIDNRLNDISNIDVDYELSELYQVDEFLNTYDQLNIGEENIKSNEIIKNGKVDLTSLYNKVLDNNSKYLMENSGIAKKYNTTTDSFVYVVCGFLSNYLNEYLRSNNSIDINGLDYKLSNLKIFDSDTFSYAYYNPDTNILGISTATVNSVKKTSGDDEAFEKIVEHEGSHIVQVGIDKEYIDSNYSMRFGPCYKFNNLEVNSGYWNWFYEATAESLVSKYHNTNSSLTYSYNINCLETLKVATILDDSNNVYTLEELANQNDLESVFNYFGCSTSQEKKELVMMMYAFNIINTDDYKSSTNDFYELYEKNYGTRMDYNSRYYLGIDLSSSISQSVSKIFYKNLYRQLSNKEVKVEDIFQNVMVLENELSRFLKYYDSSRYEYTKDFFEKYSYIQNLLFEDISRYLGVSVDEVSNAYTQYNASNEQINISYLNGDKNEFYNYILESRKSFKEISIQNIYDSFELSMNGKLTK